MATEEYPNVAEWLARFREEIKPNDEFCLDSTFHLRDIKFFNWEYSCIETYTTHPHMRHFIFSAIPYIQGALGQLEKSLEAGESLGNNSEAVVYLRDALHNRIKSDALSVEFCAD